MTQELNAYVPSARMETYRRFVSEKHEDAIAGRFRLEPEGLWLYISENCNLRCVGCYTGPGQFKKSYMSLDDAKRVLFSKEANYSYIDITSGEGFLHPQLCELIELCKSSYPKATIELVTNGSIPPRGKTRRAIEMIDGLGLSIDGATKATFEEIRCGSNFNRFIENAKEIVAIRAACGKPDRLEFCFSAMTTNIGELPGVVKIAAKIGIPSVFFQPMEMGEPEIRARVGAFDLRFMPREEIYKITDEAIALGNSLGVRVGGREYMTRSNDPDVDQLEVSSHELEEAICSCQALWTDHFRYVRSGSEFYIHPCCQMSLISAKTLSERYGLVSKEMNSVDEVFNSQAYWLLRQGQAQGKNSNFCGDCKHSFSHPWLGPNRNVDELKPESRS